MWTRLSLVTPSENAEVCAQLLLDAGCSGVQIDDSAVGFDESEDATIVAKAEATVTGYLAEGEATVAQRVAQLETALARGGLAAWLDVAPVVEQDWATSWRENFPPLRIGPFLVAPPWAEVEPDGAPLIRIDPGLAFGTGQHPTTRLCLELLAAYLLPSGPTPRLLDVGCGSGILSIAAARLGAQVTASDLDPFCTAATRDNARANGVDVQVVQAAGTAWAARPFDVVVANLMSALLIALAADLAAATRPGGWLIVSGISAPRAAEVEAALGAAGFVALEQRELEGDRRGDFVERWAAFVLRRERCID